MSRDWHWRGLQSCAGYLCRWTGEGLAARRPGLGVLAVAEIEFLPLCTDISGLLENMLNNLARMLWIVINRVLTPGGRWW